MLRFLLCPLLEQKPTEAKSDLGPLPLNAPEDLLKANETVIQKLVSGELTHLHAQQMNSLLETRRQLFETSRLEQRLRVVEDLLKPDCDPGKTG